MKGDGNELDYGMRIYDPRGPRFFSIDPIAAKYPYYSPYQFAGNNPIRAVDIDGLEPAYLVPGTNGSYRGAYVMPAGDRFKRGVPALHQQYLPTGKGGATAETDPFTQLLSDIISPPLISANTLVTHKTENGRKANAGDYAVSVGNIILFGAWGKGEGGVPAENINLSEKLPIQERAPNHEAHNAANYEKLKLDLAFQEKNSIFNKDGTLKQEVINKSEPIIEGAKLGDYARSILTADGSKIGDWSKMEYKIKQQSPTGEKTSILHYYYNSKTGKAFYDLDYKIKFSDYFFKQTPSNPNPPQKNSGN